MKKILTIIIFVVIFLTNGSDIMAASGINRKINFQGKVVNKGVGVTDGTNVTDGNYDFKFSLWSTLSAGTSLWSETWNSGTAQVTVGSGIFSVALGTYATFPPTVDFNSGSLYLSVNHNSDGEMSPRIQMAAVPYAFNAEKVGGLTVTNTTGTLTVPNGKTITFGDAFTTTGVGITLNQSLATTDIVSFGGLSIGGSASVTTNLSVGGSVTFSAIPLGTGTTVLFISGGKLVQGTLPSGGSYTATNGLNLNGSAFGLGGSLTANTQIGTSNYSLTFLGLGNTQSLFIGASGYVGIGTTNPLASLDVNGNINIAGSMAYQYANRNLISIKNVNALYFGLDAGGTSNTTNAVRNVAIGQSAMMTNTDGLSNTAIGYAAMSGNTVGWQNTAIGVGALNVGSTSNNTAIGFQAMLNTTGYSNVAIGSMAMSNNTDGYNNVAIGYYAGGSSGSGSGNVFIGNAAGQNETNSDRLYIHNSNSGSPLIWGNFSTSKVGINGALGIYTTAPAYALQVGGTGSLGVGGSVTFSGLPIGGGTSMVYISNGILTAGTLPPGGSAYTATNGLNLNGSAFGLGGTLSTLTKIDFNSNNLALFGAGSLGLGLTNPGYKLHVAGDIGTTSLTTGGFLSIGTSASVGTNLAVGGSLSMSAIPVGVGTSVLYISSTGVVTKGTLPDTGVGKSRVLTLSPEYPGASLSADGSGTTSVAMASDNTLNAGGVGWKNYYQLSSTNASLQDYSVIVRVTLPSDFDTWETGSCPGSTCALEFDYQTGVVGTADNYISYIVSNDSDTPGTAVCSIGSTASTSWGKSGCAESTLNDGGAPEWDAAGETAVVRIKMAAKNTSNALTRAGAIILRYKSKY